MRTENPKYKFTYNLLGGLLVIVDRIEVSAHEPTRMSRQQSSQVCAPPSAQPQALNPE